MRLVGANEQPRQANFPEFLIPQAKATAPFSAKGLSDFPVVAAAADLTV
jgi:hypothetical protein